MSATSRLFSAVWHKNGECPCDRYHFHGAAREVYSYLKLLAQRHGGFVFASVGNITEHTKKWNRNRVPFSESHCKRVLRMFRRLGVISDRHVCLIKGRTYNGWQVLTHDRWAESYGGMCEFKEWDKFESTRKQIMGNAKCESNHENELQNGIHNDTENGTRKRQNDTQNDTGLGTVS